MKKLIAIVAVFLFAVPVLALAQEARKIDKKNLVIKEWNTNAKGTSSILDHETIFNADGKKIEEKEFDNDGKMKWRKRYEYDAAGKVSKELVYDGKNHLKNYKTFEFNEFGRKKVQYTYNPKGKLIAIKKFEYKAQEAD